MCAALGLSQLKHFQETMNLRITAGNYLSEHLKKIKELTVPEPHLSSDHFYQMYTIKLQDQATRDALQKHLEQKSIMSKVYYNPVHLKTFYMKNYNSKAGSLPKTEAIAGKILTLPIYPGMPQAECDEIIKAITEFFK